MRLSLSKDPNKKIDSLLSYRKRLEMYLSSEKASAFFSLQYCLLIVETHHVS